MSNSPHIDQNVLFESSRFALKVNERGWTVLEPFLKGAACLGVLPDRRVVLVSEPRLDDNGVPSYQANVSKGTLEKGETPRQGAAREFTEETGIEVNPERLEFLGSARPDFTLMAATVPIFRVFLNPDELSQLPSRKEKHIQPLVLTPQQVNNYLLNGELSDCLTHSALLFSRLKSGPERSKETYIKICADLSRCSLNIQTLAVLMANEQVASLGLFASCYRDQFLLEGYCYSPNSKPFKTETLFKSIKSCLQGQASLYVSLHPNTEPKLF